LREAAYRVRELQAEWQQQARSLPLERATENALWARFKAATDAVFASRDAAAQARDAEQAALFKAREALIERLAACTGETPAAELERTLNEVERAWRHADELPRAHGGAMEERYRQARAAARRLLAEREQQRWQAQCDALAAKLALCEEREGGADAGDIEQRWAALPSLPRAWEAALAERNGAPQNAAPRSSAEVDEMLLELEAALEMPATPEQQDARRALKLRALKEAMEGRRANDRPAPSPDERFAALLRQPLVGEGPAVRLKGLVTALRGAPPDTFASAAGRH
jgi:hypothetical protein